MIICPWKEIRRYAGSIPALEEALAVIENLESLAPATYPLSNGGRVIVNDVSTTKEAGLLEAHREFLDIQYVLEGAEYTGWAPVDTLTLDGEFNTQKDVGKYSGSCQYMHIPAGYCYIVFPEDAHAPGVHLDTPLTERKIIVKLKV